MIEDIFNIYKKATQDADEISAYARELEQDLHQAQKAARKKHQRVQKILDVIKMLAYESDIGKIKEHLQLNDNYEDRE
jgi:hypothetical protein